LNAFASQVAKSAGIVGHFSKDLQIIYSPYFQSVDIVIFGLALFHFCLLTVGDGTGLQSGCVIVCKMRSPILNLHALRGPHFLFTRFQIFVSIYFWLYLFIMIS